MCYASRPGFLVFPYVTQNASDSGFEFRGPRLSIMATQRYAAKTSEEHLKNPPAALRVLSGEVHTYSCSQGILRTCRMDKTLHKVMETGALWHLACPRVQQIKCSPEQVNIKLCSLDYSMKWRVPPITGYFVKLVEWLTSVTSLALRPHSSENPGIDGF